MFLHFRQRCSDLCQNHCVCVCVYKNVHTYTCTCSLFLFTMHMYMYMYTYIIVLCCMFESHINMYMTVQANDTCHTGFTCLAGYSSPQSHYMISLAPAGETPYQVLLGCSEKMTMMELHMNM